MKQLLSFLLAFGLIAICASSQVPNDTSTVSITNAQPETKLSDLGHSLGLNFALVNDLAISYHQKIATDVELAFSFSAYLNETGSRSELRYRGAIEGQITIFKENSMRTYVIVGAQKFRRSNAWYEMFNVNTNIKNSVRESFEPYAGIGAEHLLYKKISLSVAVLVDRLIIENPQYIGYLFYAPVIYPELQMGLHFRF